jgi:hypothetical protein
LYPEHIFFHLGLFTNFMGQIEIFNLISFIIDYIFCFFLFWRSSIVVNFLVSHVSFLFRGVQFFQVILFVEGFSNFLNRVDLMTKEETGRVSVFLSWNNSFTFIFHFLVTTQFSSDIGSNFWWSILFILFPLDIVLF